MICKPLWTSCKPLWSLCKPLWSIRKPFWSICKPLWSMRQRLHVCVNQTQARVHDMQAPVVNNEFVGCTRTQSDSHTHAGVEKTPQAKGRSTGKLVVLERNLTRIHTPTWRTHHRRPVALEGILEPERDPGCTKK